MITSTLLIDAEKSLYELINSNDKEFGKNRTTLKVSYNKDKVKIEINAKDLPSFRAAHKMIENTLIIWEKAKAAI